MQFHPNLLKVYTNRGLLQAGLNAASSVTIYSGVQPTAAAIAAAWASYNSTQPSFLCHYTGVIWVQALAGKAPFASINTFPADATPTNNGTGTWAIIWPSNVLLAAMGDATIPNVDFIVGPVSLTDGDGIIKFDSVAFATSTPKPLAEGILYCTLG